MNFKTVRRVIAVVFAVVCALGAPRFAGAATFTVTTTNDSGAGSLRWAITNSIGTGGTNTIAFNIPGGGVQTITPNSGYPTITTPTIIDAYTQPGSSPNTLSNGNNAVILIRLNGVNAGGANALHFKSGGCAMRGLAIINFGSDAVRLESISDTQISGNFIGVDADGVTAGANNGWGINCTSDNAKIGGTSPDQRNVISGNASGGIEINGVTNVVIQGNYIGTDACGTHPMGNAGDGVYLTGGNTTGINIGGLIPGAGNVISANTGTTSDGVFVNGCTGNYISGNFIGTDPTGTAALGNGGNGVQVKGGNGNVVGWTNANYGNIIAFNGLAGVAVPSGTQVAIVGNSIYLNSGLGIDLGNTGVLANDTLDTDNGANNLQNYPVLTNALCDGTTTTVQGSLNSTASTTFRIEFFRSSVCDSSGYGQGKSYLGFTNVTTSASGIANFNIGFATGPVVGNYISATATDTNGNTSEFSACASVSGVQPPVILAPLGGLLGILGQTIILSVDASGSQSLKYQWRLNGTPIPGATNALYTILSLAPINAGAYSVVIYNGLGAAHSEPALVGITGLLAAPMTDNFSARGTFNGLSVTASANNNNATSEPGEPLHAGKPGGKSMWMTWVPTLSGVAIVSTIGSSFDTLLAIYQGNTLTSLTSLVSDDESGGYHTSSTTFNVVGGTPYIIAVDGAGGQSGRIILNCNVILTSQSVATVLAQPLDNTVGTNMSATFSVNASGSSLSYQWFFDGTAIPGATGWTYSMNTVTPSAVGVYQVKVQSGTQVIYGQPAQLQINYSDTGVDSNARAYDKLSDAVFEQAVIAGAHYHTLSAPARGFSGTQIFSTYNSTQDPGEPENCGVPGGASSWFAYQPPYNGLLTIDTDGSTFDTLLGVYTGDGNDFSTLVSVACDNNSGTNGRTSKVVFNATGGTTYWIAVDGVNGAYGTVYLHYNLSTPPIFTADPSGGTVSAGGMATLNANVTGNPTSKYQWLRNQTPVSGQTNLTLSIANFQTANEGAYQLLASNNMGIVTSATAQLLVSSPMRMGSCCFNSGQFQFELVGSANSNYVLQASSDLVHWQSLATNNSPNGLWNFSDPGSSGAPFRFYRAITQ